ncbi:Beta-galactosidase [Zostera marina]|uniref:beta-galactosidase n=1 Tax=Zostera marina TaxID=29655 RepID=A0A0K9P9X4_ZOSMR|nr:Beta-galactosidase [Zostera marina]
MLLFPVFDQMWEGLIQKAKDGDVDVIQTYVFWNGHEPSPGNIENEYGPESKAFGFAGHSYMDWDGKMVVGMQTGVPWVMCKEEDAPDPINTCNGVYCDAFTPNQPYKPKMWTEAWSVVRSFGEKRVEEKLKNYELVELLDIADLIKGANVAGGRGYYLKGAGARLNMPLIQFAFDFLESRNY